MSGKKKPRASELPIPSRKASVPSSERVLPEESPKGILAKGGGGGAPVGVTQEPLQTESRRAPEGGWGRTARQLEGDPGTNSGLSLSLNASNEL